MRLRRRRRIVIQEDDAQHVFDGFVPDLIKIPETGWNVWRECERAVPAAWIALSERTRANFVYDQMLIDAKKRFEGVSGVRLIERPGVPTLFEFEERVLLGFKKLTRECRPSSYPTKQQVLLLEQQLQLPGMLPDLPYVVLGYRLDKLGQNLRDVLMISPNGRGNPPNWAWQISEATAGVIQTSMFAAQEQKRARVKAKKRKASGE